MDAQVQKIQVKCPHCEETFEKEVEVSIYESRIDVEVEVVDN